MKIVNTPTPPYYAVIFTAKSSANQNGYEEMAVSMLELAKQQPGFLGAESVDDTLEITISYWESLEAIQAWKTNADHQEAQKYGREKWYTAYKIRIAKVEREYSFEYEK